MGEKSKFMFRNREAHMHISANLSIEVSIVSTNKSKSVTPNKYYEYFIVIINKKIP